MEVKIKKLTDTAHIPTRGTSLSAGYDLYSDHEHKLIIQPGKMHKIHTGIAVEIPQGYFGAVFARSGLAFKQNLRPVNCVGVIDCDYNQEIIVGLYNDSDQYAYIEPYERVAQLVILPYQDIDFVEVQEIEEKERTGGFGSTGKF